MAKHVKLSHKCMAKLVLSVAKLVVSVARFALSVAQRVLSVANCTQILN